jgi:hypothetical protein
VRWCWTNWWKVTSESGDIGILKKKHYNPL